MFNLDYNSIELQQFCKNISNKKRLFWENLLNSQFSSDISQIRDLLSIDIPRQLLYHIINDLPVINKCVCGNNLTWNTPTKKYLTYCSVTCSTISTADSRKKTNIQKYGVDNYAKSKEFLEKSKSTFIKNYGVNNPSKNADVQNKKIESFRRRFGVDNPMLSTDVKEKLVQTNLQRYGVDYPSQSTNVRIKIKESTKKTNLAKYGVEHSAQRNISISTLGLIQDKIKFSEYITGKTISDISQSLLISNNTIYLYARMHNITDLISKSTVSTYETHIKTILDELDISYIINSKKIIPPLQVDFYLPDYNVAIEVGSCYWHGELSNNKDKTYHYNKWKMCKDQNIILLQYFDNDIINNLHLVKSKINRLCNIPTPIIGARKLKLLPLQNYNIESEFLIHNHLQGPTSNRNLVIGAYNNSQLVGVSSWIYKDNNAELIRYAIDVNYSFPGLFSRMLAKFKSLTNFKGTLISFSDNRHSNGSLYMSTQFNLMHVTNPGYMYFKNNGLESRLKYQKHKLAKIFDLTPEYVNSHTEWQIMQEQGYDRLWDAGQSKWLLAVK